MSEEQWPCDARTARQASWGGSGCQRWAVTQVDGHWACKQHAEKPPPNGWNVVPRACERPRARGPWGSLRPLDVSRDRGLSDTG
jgi:hypothetical protein